MPEAKKAKIVVDGKDLGGIPGNELTDLNTPNKIENVWAMPYGTIGNCTTCHGSTDPFLRTAVVRNMKLTNGKPLLPPKRIDSPFKIVAFERLREVQGGFIGTDWHPKMKKRGVSRSSRPTRQIKLAPSVTVLGTNIFAK